MMEIDLARVGWVILRGDTAMKPVTDMAVDYPTFAAMPTAEEELWVAFNVGNLRYQVPMSNIGAFVIRP